MSMFEPIFVLLIGAAPTSTNDWQWGSRSEFCSLRQNVPGGNSTIEIGRSPANVLTSVTLENYPKKVIREGIFKSALIRLDSTTSSPAEIFATSAEIRQPSKVVAVTTDENFLDRLSNVSTISFEHPKMGALRIPIRSASAAVSALGKCEDKKMSALGIDPVQWHSLKSRPIPLTPWSEWFSSDDYPPDAALYLVEGSVIVRLDVSSDGLVQNCRAEKPSRYTGFADAVCKSFRKRARFKPAVNSDGVPTSAPYVVVVSFQMAS